MTGLSRKISPPGLKSEMVDLECLAVFPDYRLEDEFFEESSKELSLDACFKDNSQFLEVIPSKRIFMLYFNNFDIFLIELLRIMKRNV